MSNATQIIHSIPVDEQTGAIAVPIYQTSTFVQEAPGVNKGYDYARRQPRATLETIIAKLEEGSVGVAFGSGLAAIDAVVKLLKSGDEILAVDDIYGGAFRLFTHIYEKFGIKSELYRHYQSGKCFLTRSHQTQNSSGLKHPPILR